MIQSNNGICWICCEDLYSVSHISEVVSTIGIHALTFLAIATDKALWIRWAYLRIGICTAFIALIC
jgi:uncharacterized membrane protein